MHIVEALEVVEIDEHNAQGLLLAHRPVKFPLERFGHVAPVEQSRERVANGLFSQSFTESNVGHRQGNLVGDRNRQGLLCAPRGFRLAGGEGEM